MTQIVLLGGGHAHVEALRAFARRPLRGARLVLVSREARMLYTGLLPAVLRGECAAEAAEIDLPALAARAGARFVQGEAVALDLEGRRVLLAGGASSVPFGLLSLDVGGVSERPAGPCGSAADRGGDLAAKPIGRFLDRFLAAEPDLLPGTTLAVIGAGAGGTELAIALALRLRGRATVALAGLSGPAVPEAPAKARRVLAAGLHRAGVVSWPGSPPGAASSDAGAEAAGRRDTGHRDLGPGNTRECDTGQHGRGDPDAGDPDAGDRAAGHHATGAGGVPFPDGHRAVTRVIWATGIRAPDFLARSGLECDALGCARVAPTLRSLSHGFVFAAGDCAAVDGAARPKAGVWAVRAGPILAANLRRATEGRALRRWRPQRRALAIVGLGGRRAVAWRGRFGFGGTGPSGWIAWRWKEWLDRRWVARFR